MLVEYCGGIALCRLAIDGPTASYECIRCYGSGDPVFDRHRARPITQEFVVIKHEKRSRFGVFWCGSCFAIRICQTSIACFARSSSMPLRVVQDAIEAAWGEGWRDPGQGAIINPAGGRVPSGRKVVNSEIPSEEISRIEDGI